MKNSNGIEVLATETMAAAADIAELDASNDPTGLQRAALEGVTELTGKYNRRAARNCVGALHLRAFFEDADAAAEFFFGPSA